MAKRVCDMDCFNCVYPDCIRNEANTDKNRWCNRSEAYREKQLQLKKILYKSRKANGLCVHCGKKATYGVRCYEHYLRSRRYNETHKSSKQATWQYLGKCYFCGEDVLPGKKTCKKHYEIFRKNGKHMSQSEGGIKSQKDFVNRYRR